MDSRRSADPPPSFRFGRLLIIVVAVFMLSAVNERWASLAISLSMIALVLVAFRATSLRTSSPKLAALTLMTIAAAIITALADRDSPTNAAAAFVGTALMSILLLLILHQVAQSERVDGQTIVGAVTAYAMIGLAFATFYVGIDLIDDDQLSIPNSDRPQYTTFSYVVLTTLGFGDQTPTAPFASRIVVLEAMIGQIFLTVFIARLVSMYRRPGGLTPSTGDAPAADPDGS